MIAEFRTLPARFPWLERNWFKLLIALRGDLVDEMLRPDVSTTYDVQHELKRFRELERSVKEKGFLVSDPYLPRVVGLNVMTGNHRICYCLARNMPCLVDYRDEMRHDSGRASERNDLEASLHPLREGSSGVLSRQGEGAMPRPGVGRHHRRYVRRSRA